MMSYDHKNLADTVHATTVYETLRCEVGSEPSVWTARYNTNLIPYHRWSDHCGGLKGGVCQNCGKTLKEVRVRINPKTGEPVRKPSRIAREISQMRADMPPVVFVNRRQS